MAISNEDLIDWIKTMAECLNIKYFDGVLNFEVKTHHREISGWYARVEFVEFDADKRLKVLSAPILRINPVLDHANVPEIEKIILHELVHVAQYALKMKLDHGKSFREVINRFQVPLEMTVCGTRKMLRHPDKMKLDAKLKR